MKTEFKKVLEIIDSVALQTIQAEALFSDGSKVNPADERLLCAWSGKAITDIRLILSPGYGKRQLGYNPFTGDLKAASAIRFEAWLPGEQPEIHYSVQETIYGRILLAATPKGICYLVFYSGSEEKVAELLKKEFPGSVITRGTDKFQTAALALLNGDVAQVIHLHVKGTPGQLRTWEALTRVSSGKLIAYGTLAKATGQLAQDIGVTMGDNRIAVLIPCHRVIKATGEPGQYHWGAGRKQAMILREALFNSDDHV